MGEHKNIMKVIHVALSFFLLFTAFSSCQNVVSEAYDQNHYGSLGFYTLAALYITFGFASFASGPLVAKIGHIRAMQIGAFCYFIWVVAGILPIALKQSHTVKIAVWVIMMVAGIINGFGASILWVGEGIYVGECSSSQNKGLFFGLFWCILMLSQILGNLIAAFVVKLFSKTIMFIVMGCFSFVGFCMFLFLRKPEKVIEQNSSDINKSSIKKDGDKDSLLENEDTGKDDPENLEENLLELGELNVVEDPSLNSATLSSTMKLLMTSKMLRVSLLIAVSGIVLAVFSGMLIKMISATVSGDDDKKLTNSLYCMIVFGFGEVSGALIISRIIDKLGNRVGVLYTTLVMVLTVALTVYVHSTEKYGILWFIVALMWGFCDSKSNTVCSTICSSEFESTIEPFAILKFVQSLTTCAFLIFESYIKDNDQMTEQRWYLIGIGIFSLISGLLCATIKFKNKPKVNQ